MSHDSTKSTASRYLTVSAHFYPGLVVQLGSASNLQVGYQISTGRPCLEHNHRQEGIPPSPGRLIRPCVPTDFKLLRRMHSLAEVGVPYSRDRMRSGQLTNF